MLFLIVHYEHLIVPIVTNIDNLLEKKCYVFDNHRDKLAKNGQTSTLNRSGSKTSPLEVFKDCVRLVALLCVLMANLIEVDQRSLFRAIFEEKG